MAAIWNRRVRARRDLSPLDLRIQVGPDEPGAHDLLTRLGARPFAEGVVQTLVTRTPDGIRAVAEADLVAAGADVEATWLSARALTRTLERPSEINVINTGRVDLLHVYSEHRFGASFVPYLDDVLPERLDLHGAVVSMPMRQSVLVHPIRGGEVIEAVQAMIPITRQIHRQGPASVSAHLYWWQAGHLTWIPTYFAADGIEFYPPAEFADLIDAIDDII